MTRAADADGILFSDTLACDDEFPFALRAPGGRYESSDAARRSEITLRALGSLDESRNDDADAAENVSPRLEAKVDLALALLAVLAAQQHTLPAAQPVRWSRLGFRCAWDSAFAPGVPALCSVYLAAGLPLPIDLPVQVLACEPRDGRFLLWLRIADASPALGAGIESEMFRRNRQPIQERHAAHV